MYDINDEALLNDVFGEAVAWEYEGCPHFSPRQQLEGVIVDVRTKRDVRQVLVKSPALNLPKWVNVQDVQFVGNKTATAA